HAAELDRARDALERTKDLARHSATTTDEVREAETKCRICRAQLKQAEAERRSRQAKGTLEAQAELGRRDKELADARATLTLLEAGTRPEEVQAEQARLARLREEVRYLEGLTG